jgi:hypothetical protein
MTDFFVTRRGRAWFVDVGADVHGPYLSRRDALADALDAAEKAGRRAAVLVKVPGSDAAVVWRSGWPRPEAEGDADAAAPGGASG